MATEAAQTRNSVFGDIPLYAAIVGLLAACFILSAIIPPGQSPDEQSHLERAYRLSKGHVLLETGPGGSGGPVDDGLLRFISLFHGVGVGAQMDSALARAVLPQIEWAGTESWAQYAGTGYYFPAIYIPQAVAFAIGRYSDLSIDHSYQLARLFAFTCSALLVVLSIRLVRPSFAVTALLTMPMVVFQAISATIDALSLGLCMLAASSFLSLLSGRDADRDGARIIVLCLVVFVLASSRAHALPLVILPFILAWQRRSRACSIAAAAVLLCAVLWTVYALLAVHDERVVRNVSTIHILRHYLTHPEEFVRLLLHTLSIGWRFYRDTFIGRLGYLDVYLPQLYLIFATLALLLLAVLSTKWERGTQGERLGRLSLVFCAFASSVLVFAALTVTWTPFPSTFIEGVQGRYLHIPALLLAYSLCGVPTKQSRAFKGVSMAVYAAFLIAGAYVMTVALIDRYWLHDPSYARPLPSQRHWVPLAMKSGDVVTAEYVPQANGSLNAATFILGTYAGASDGVLTLRICHTECATGTVDVAEAQDNQPAYFLLDHPLVVSPEVPVQVSLSLSASRHPVAVWSSHDNETLRLTEDNGHDGDVVPLFQAAIR
ncbi:hypothetical protein AKI39_23635 [Bordetella sp. H567]|nr:hypothetical protein AKI39_23635 [Bordetella sp. H567]